ncbi:hypothetical protein ACSBR1_015521 [Camellia fascicularis]
MHGRLLTNQLRVSRDFDSNDLCPRCHSNGESMSHLLRDCYYSSELWKNLKNDQWIRDGIDKPLDAWLSFNLCDKTKLASINWNIWFTVTLWFIWKGRNKTSFDNCDVHISDSLRLVFQYTQEIHEAFQCPLSSDHQRIKLINWLPPLTGNIKLNADGCAKESLGKADFGGLFRDTKSSWILGYSGKLDVATSLEAEIWAIYHGTTIIHEKGWRNVIIETDCQDVVNLINEGAHPNCSYRALVEDIKFLTSRMDCIIKHIFQEANQCADTLAHMRENQVEDLKIYEDPLILLRPILMIVIVRIVYERD